MASLESVLEPLAAAHKGTVAVAVKHLGTGEEFRRNADEPLPTASLIKFPVMVEAYHQFADGQCRPSDLVILADADKVPGSGVLTDHFSAGATYSLRDAVRLMIVFSDNTATNQVLDHVGILAVNARMEKYGLPETKIHSKVYRRSTSSIDLKRSEKYGLGSTTANDMVKLLELLHAGKLVSEKASQEMTGHMLKCDDPDKFPKLLPPGTKVAMKTGSVSDARTAAGLIYFKAKGKDKPPPPVAVCVLSTITDEKEKGYHPNQVGDVLCAKVAKAVYDHFAEAR